MVVDGLVPAQVYCCEMAMDDRGAGVETSSGQDLEDRRQEHFLPVIHA